MNAIEQYIRKAALARGMDPDKVLRAVNTEGGTRDPFQQSFAKKNGIREPSYGPLQLLIGGPGTGYPTGLGNAALEAGIDPRTNWQGGVDFGLDTVAREGWGQWYGPKNAGLDRWYGVRGSKPVGTTLASNPYAGMADGPKGQESYPRMAPPLPPPTNVRDYNVAEANPAMTTDPGSLDGLKEFFKTDTGKSVTGGFGDLMAAFGGGSSGGSSAPQIQPSSIGPAVSSEIQAQRASAQAMMAQLLEARRGKTKRRVPGVSLMG